MACIAYRLNDTLDKRKSLRIAARDFRNAINPEGFKEMRGHILHGALIQTFPDFKKAVHEFRLHLGITEKISLDRVWKEYHGEGEECPDFFVMYCLHDNGPSLLKQRLEKLRKAGEIT
jgi:hypothetical protein